MGALTLQQASEYAQAAGFSGSALQTILAIAQAESGLDPLATNTNTDFHTFPDGHTGPSVDRGILQINNYWQPQVSNAVAFNPATAFVAGFAISARGTTFTPWSTYQSGAYKRYLPVTAPAPITRMLPNAVHFSEFQGGYHGTCGETALASAEVCATPPIETTAQAIALMLSITATLRTEGQASVSGATTTAALREYAIAHGFTIAPGHVDYQQPLDPAMLHPYLLAHAGLYPIILELANAQALPGDGVGVHYHFLCVVGINPAGYVCNDGDNTAAPTRLVTYSWAQLEAAIPCGLLGIEMQLAPAHLPAGWKDAGGLLSAPGSAFTVGTGFREYILAHPWEPSEVPLGPETDVAEVEVANPTHGAGTVQYFPHSALIWSRSENVVLRSWVGREAMVLREQVAKREAEIAALQKQVAATPAPLDPAVKNVLAAALQQLQPFATLSAELKAALATLG